MFKGFTQETIDFMWNIRFNNEKTWFEAHKSEYINNFLTPMKELGRDIYDRLQDDINRRGLIHKVSRIYRDARRLHGRGPYKDNLWFSFERPGEVAVGGAGFWFELSPEGWSYGMGFYEAPSATMAKYRARIDNDTKAFEKLIAPLSKQDEFALDGPEYVRKKEAPSKKTAEWYNKKSFSLIHRQPNGDELFSPDLAERLSDGYKFLLPIYDFLASVTADSNPNI